MLNTSLSLVTVMLFTKSGFSVFESLLDALPHFRSRVALQSVDHHIACLPFHNHAERRFMILANDRSPMTRYDPSVRLRPIINGPDIETSLSILISFLAPFTLQRSSSSQAFVIRPSCGNRDVVDRFLAHDYCSIICLIPQRMLFDA